MIHGTRQLRDGRRYLIEGRRLRYPGRANGKLSP